MLASSATEAWWNDLPEPLRAETDRLVTADKRFAALKVLVEVQGRRPTLTQLQHLVQDRYVVLGNTVQQRPTQPEWSDLQATASEITEPIVAIEAIWDGDTAGWYIVLLAIVTRTGPTGARLGEVQLGSYRNRGGDFRLFCGDVPPWPEAQAATRDGTRLAEALAVPFHFSSPTTPTLDPARWWDDAQ